MSLGISLVHAIVRYELDSAWLQEIWHHNWNFVNTFSRGPTEKRVDFMHSFHTSRLRNLRRSWWQSLLNCRLPVRTWVTVA